MGKASEWSAHYDSKGYLYYFNSVTGESSWTAPEEFHSPTKESERQRTLRLESTSRNKTLDKSNNAKKYYSHDETEATQPSDTEQLMGFTTPKRTSAQPSQVKMTPHPQRDILNVKKKMKIDDIAGNSQIFPPEFSESQESVMHEEHQVPSPNKGTKSRKQKQTESNDMKTAKADKTDGQKEYSKKHPKNRAGDGELVDSNQSQFQDTPRVTSTKKKIVRKVAEDAPEKYKNAEQRTKKRNPLDDHEKTETVKASSKKTQAQAPVQAIYVRSQHEQQSDLYKSKHRRKLQDRQQKKNAESSFPSGAKSKHRPYSDTPKVDTSEGNKEKVSAGFRHGLSAGEIFVRERRIYGFESAEDPSSVDRKEGRARAKAIKSPFSLTSWALIAAFKTVFFFLVTFEAIISSLMTAGLTCLWYSQPLEKISWHTSLNFLVVTFTVISPISAGIGMAFTRREKALKVIAAYRSISHHLYVAHSLWDWTNDGGRASMTDFDFLEHCDGVLEQLVAIGDELSRFLSLPTWTRGRHRLTIAGRQEAVRHAEVAYSLLDSITTQRMDRLAVYAERLKMIGLSESESSRMRDYERYLSLHIEELRMLKMHRTPQVLWGFARVFTLFLPPLYAPVFAEIAREMDLLAMGLVLGIVTSVVFTAIVEIIQVMEDPFVTFLDGIDTRDEFDVMHWSQLINSRRFFFPDAPDFSARRYSVLTSPSLHQEVDSDEELGTMGGVNPYLKNMEGLMSAFAGTAARSRRRWDSHRSSKKTFVLSND